MRRTLYFLIVIMSAQLALAGPPDGARSILEPFCSQAQSPPRPHKNPCTPATKEQTQLVNEGAAKKDKFLEVCAEETEDSPLCLEIIRPNPESRSTFHCTYSKDQPPVFIPPDENMWAHAFFTINTLEAMRTRDIRVCRIYNWWRPEPYNTNVDGEPGRHPFGTAVDVRFSTPEDQEAAFWFLCGLKNLGDVNAIGFYYRTPSLHIGVADNPQLDDIWGGVRCRRSREDSVRKPTRDR